MSAGDKKSKFGRIFSSDGRSESKNLPLRRESSSSGDEQDQLLAIVESKKSKSDKSLLRRKASHNDHDYAALMEATALSAKHLSKGSSSSSSKSGKKLGSSLRGVSKKEALEQELEHLKAMSSLNERINTQQTYITKLEMQVSRLDDRLSDLENALNTEKQRSLIADTTISNQSCLTGWFTSS